MDRLLKSGHSLHLHRRGPSAVPRRTHRRVPESRRPRAPKSCWSPGRGRRRSAQAPPRYFPKERGRDFLEPQRLLARSAPPRARSRAPPALACRPAVAWHSDPDTIEPALRLVSWVFPAFSLCDSAVWGTRAEPPVLLGSSGFRRDLWEGLACGTALSGQPLRISESDLCYPAMELSQKKGGSGTI